MAVNGKRFGATIILSPTKSYHTNSDWGLIMTNGDPVGDPEQETNYLAVPGRSNLLDWTEALNGGLVFKGRTISIDMAFTGDPELWSMKVSIIRNAVEGRKVKIVFDDDRSHYWLGRIAVQDTDRVKRLGHFTLSAYVDAYKYDIADSQEKLRWDDMNFLTDCLRYIGELTVTDSGTVTIPHGGMKDVPANRGIVPVFNVSSITSETFTVRSNRLNKTFTLSPGRNRFPDLKVCGEQDVTLTFTGSANVTISYRGETL